MKRCLAGWLTLFLLFAAVSGFALTYSVDPATGLYVDESGEVIAEYWDEGAGIYIVDGFLRRCRVRASSESGWRHGGDLV